MSFSRVYRRVFRRAFRRAAGGEDLRGVGPWGVRGGSGRAAEVLKDFKGFETCCTVLKGCKRF